MPFTLSIPESASRTKRHRAGDYVDSGQESARPCPKARRIGDTPSFCSSPLVQTPIQCLHQFSEQSVVDLCDGDENEYSLDDDIIEVIDKPTEAKEEVQIISVKPSSRKHVTFSEIQHEVFYFKPHSSEDVVPSLSAIAEDDQSISFDSPDGVSDISQQNRATAEFTVMSSHHGRARRALRNISKRDLQAAIKYGVKMRAQPDPRTRAPRWKFVYNNLVYITDYTCTHEITSFKEAVRIQSYPISRQLMDHHIDVKRILEEQPHLCTSHTFIVIDQSGSMRNADVDGFVSRSQAAYGTLASDFVAEQLKQRTSQDHLVVESVTVIEMRNKGEVVLARHPLDWVLFNRILNRQQRARPYSHGNYKESLSLVQKMINEEYELLMKSGLEPDDMPHFTLAFLSDGRPSDSTPLCAQQQVDLVSEFSTRLKSKFSLYAMGVGPNGADFKPLISMVETAKKNGCEAQFIHAGLSKILMSATFSEMSSTMTSRRSELLSCEHAQNANSITSLKKFTMRETGKIVGKEMPVCRYVNAKQYSVKRFRFNKNLFKKDGCPWKQVDFGNHGAIGFEVEKSPFGKGSERLAYRFHELSYDEHTKKYKKVGKTMVAKASIYENEKEMKEYFHKDFCRVQSAASELAEKFNDAVRIAPTLQSLTGVTRPPTLQFLLCHVYTYKDNETKEESGYLVEKFLNGKFTKYNSNNGYVKRVKEGDNNSHTIELVSGKVPFEEFLQSFSHWVYIHSNHEMIVCDIQGVLNQEGRYPVFQLTDPAICTKKKPRYGKTDMRMKGIRNFCRTHCCGLVCKGLGLPSLKSSHSSHSKNSTS